MFEVIPLYNQHTKGICFKLTSVIPQIQTAAVNLCDEVYRSFHVVAPYAMLISTQCAMVVSVCDVTTAVTDTN